MPQVVKLGSGDGKTPIHEHVKKGSAIQSPADSTAEDTRRQKKLIAILAGLIAVSLCVILYFAVPKPTGEAPSSSPADAIAGGPKEVMDEPPAKDRIRQAQKGDDADEPPHHQRR